MLSVIIPCYNAAETIATQLEALANQCHCSEPWEIIVADNGSSDNSRLIVKKYQQQLPNLRLVDASYWRGSAHARNVGVLAAKGEKLAFCDADDEVASNWVETMSKALDEYDFVAGRLEPFKLNEPWVLKSRVCPQNDGLQTYDYPAYLYHAGGCNLGVKRALHEAVGGLDETIPVLDDTDYCWRIQLAGTTIHFVPDAVVHYRYRHTLPGIYRQARDYGKYNVLLYKRYRPLGMPKLHWHVGTRRWRKVFRQLRRARTKSGLARWCWTFGWRLGRLCGSIRYRSWAL
jgi:glycosyltransferase involved in cell wall biosynthesis